MTKQSEEARQKKLKDAGKVDPEQTRFTAEEALQEGADRMALRYGKKDRAEILAEREERAEAAALAAEERAAALSADADATGVTRPNADPETPDTPAPDAPAPAAAKKTAAPRS